MKREDKFVSKLVKVVYQTQLLKWLLGQRCTKILAIGSIFQVGVSSIEILFLILITKLVSALQSGSTDVIISQFHYEMQFSIGVLLLAICSIVVIKNVLNLTWQKFITKNFAVREATVTTLFIQAALYEDLGEAKRNHSADLLQLTTTIMSSIFVQFFRSLISFISEFVTLVAVSVGIFIIDPKVGFLTVLFCLINGLALTKIIGDFQQKAGHESVKANNTFLRKFSTLQRLRKEIWLDRSEDTELVNLLAEKEIASRASATSSWLNSVPRYFLEIMFIVGLTGITQILAIFNTDENYLAIYALLIAAGYRILPSLNIIVSSFGGIRSARSALIRVDELSHRFKLRNVAMGSLNRTRESAPIDFRGELVIDNLNFSYHATDYLVFDNFALTMPANSTLLIQGESGSGKTTLLGLICGFLTPDTGKIFLRQGNSEISLSNNMSGISYLSQEVPLFDESYAFNVALGYPREIDKERISQVIDQVGLSALINSQPQGIYSHVGENGQLLSAGEKQRLGMARTLFKFPKLIILDEPTANLDELNENIFWDLLERLNGQLSIILVSHRPVPRKVWNQKILLEPKKRRN